MVDGKEGKSSSLALEWGACPLAVRCYNGATWEGRRQKVDPYTEVWGYSEMVEVVAEDSLDGSLFRCVFIQSSFVLFKKKMCLPRIWSHVLQHGVIGL